VGTALFFCYKQILPHPSRAGICGLHKVIFALFTTLAMDRNLLLQAYRLMYSAKVMAETYEANRTITKYVHSTSRGHEAIQLATGFQLKPQDWVSPYYRDESMLLAMGWSPYELMLQLLTKADDPFTGGRSYYAHPNSRAENKPKIIHQSSATGMQAIPTTGVAQGIQYKEKAPQPPGESPPTPQRVDWPPHNPRLSTNLQVTHPRRKAGSAAHTLPPWRAGGLLLFVHWAMPA
jgi:hypothetical protein